MKCPVTIKKAKRLSQISLISSICFFLGLAGSIIGVLCGQLAIRKYRSLGIQEGRGNAKLGILIGYIGLGVNVLIIILALTLFISYTLMDGGSIFHDFDSFFQTDGGSIYE